MVQGLLDQGAEINVQTRVSCVFAVNTLNDHYLSSYIMKISGHSNLIFPLKVPENLEIIPLYSSHPVFHICNTENMYLVF